MQSQQSLMLIKNQGFFPADLSYTNGLGDLHHLLARGLLTFYDSLQGLINKDLFSLRVMILRFSAIF